MRLRTLPLRYKVYVFAAVLVLTAWLFVSYVLLPTKLRLVEMENQLRRERSSVKVLQGFGMAYPEPNKYLKLLDDKLVLLECLLPTEACISEFLSQSEEAAKASGVQLISLKPGSTVNKNGYREWMMEQVIRGSYFQTMNYYKKIEEGPRYNTVSNIAIQSKIGYLESKLTISIFSFGAAPAPTLLVK